jgi:hypothetical protein
MQYASALLNEAEVAIFDGYFDKYCCKYVEKRQYSLMQEF